MPVQRLTVVALVAVALLAAPAVAQEEGLVATLAKSLGVTSQQAEGGAGLLMNYAKSALGADDFTKLAGSMPEVGPLAEAGAKLAAPAAGAMGSTGGTAALLGAAAGAAGGGSPLGIASLAGSFEKLGLSSDMVGKFAPAIVDYATKKGGDAPALLGKAFGLAGK